ncbi:hypothetical protein H1C71_000394 [Ictidomys tridecemlineatus]|nr:hypothetical protein H1C71_000394 [Ictidomys tridecemlineatus]
MWPGRFPLESSLCICRKTDPSHQEVASRGVLESAGAGLLELIVKLSGILQPIDIMLVSRNRPQWEYLPWGSANASNQAFVSLSRLTVEHLQILTGCTGVCPRL